MNDILKKLPLEFFVTESEDGKAFVDHEVIDAADYLEHSSLFDEVMCEAYTLLVKKPQTIEKADTFCIGDRFVHNGEEHILMQTDYFFIGLMCTVSFNRFATPIKVVNVESITYDELDQMVGLESLEEFKCVT